MDYIQDLQILGTFMDKNQEPGVYIFQKNNSPPLISFFLRCYLSF